ncbi:MAG TPA: hemerythrin domain-containing protein [Myxococcales bacterium]|nr:hemerythrin domain-containing protein [Myxococcales bacterium]
MTHEERRQTLHSQHQQLRTVIAGVREAALDIVGREGGDSTGLRMRISVLRDDLERHLATEEALLGPVLERIDAWGPVRLDLLRAEHAHQRAVLSLLRSDRAAALPSLGLARRVLALLDDICADMDAEDRDLLDPRVLRDDLIQLDASDA